MLADGMGVAGAVLVSVGAGLVYFPAGLVVAGVFCIVVAARLAVADRLTK